jgi:hypothetical protein
MLKKLSVFVLLMFAGVAGATPLVVDLSICNSALCAIDGIDPGDVLATVSAEDVTGGINFTVTTRDPGWLLWDGKLFAFNAADGGNLALPVGYESVGPLEVDGFETFQYVINGPTAGGLAANGVTTFSFSVTGLRLSDLTPNAGGYLFAAHIGVPDGTCDGGPCAGLTGFVADGEPVPEVGTLEMFGGALIAFGVLVKRYRLRHA